MDSKPTYKNDNRDHTGQQWFFIMFVGKNIVNMTFKKQMTRWVPGFNSYSMCWTPLSLAVVHYHGSCRSSGAKNIVIHNYLSDLCILCGSIGNHLAKFALVTMQYNATEISQYRLVKRDSDVGNQPACLNPHGFTVSGGFVLSLRWSSVPGMHVGVLNPRVAKLYFCRQISCFCQCLVTRYIRYEMFIGFLWNIFVVRNWH